MSLFFVWHQILICIVVSLCKHASKEVCDIKPGIDPYSLLARSCNRWWPDFVTFTPCEKSRLSLKKGQKRRNAFQTGAKIWGLRQKHIVFTCLLLVVGVISQLVLWPQVAQARYMSSSMWTFALLRDSSDLHIYKDLYGERNKPEKKRKITVELQ